MNRCKYNYYISSRTLRLFTKKVLHQCVMKYSKGRKCRMYCVPKEIYEVIRKYSKEGKSIDEIHDLSKED